MDPASDILTLAENAGQDPLILGAILILYVALIAMPFVPGAEIGLFLMALFGAAMAIPVYLATVAALTLSYSLGQLAPGVVLLGSRGRPAVATALPGAPRWHEVTASRSSGWLPRLVRYRWLALVVLINTPGNTLLGGGGGIAMAAGASGAFRFPAFLVAVAVAVAPVPLAVVLADHFDAGAALGGQLQTVIDAFGPQASHR
ncbi:MAG: hypothetical protein QNJ44_20630 [Rhodobacter sp.]|nr:hypothetical protein [Rhodobacter sp.]